MCYLLTPSCALLVELVSFGTKTWIGCLCLLHLTVVFLRSCVYLCCIIVGFFQLHVFYYYVNEARVSPKPNGSKKYCVTHSDSTDITLVHGECFRRTIEFAFRARRRVFRVYLFTQRGLLHRCDWVFVSLPVLKLNRKRNKCNFCVSSVG